MHLLSSNCVGRIMTALKLSNVRYLLILFVLLAGLPFRASAQDATIVGTVTDPSGSVIANVKITITNAETGLARNTTTNDSGQYVAAELRVGPTASKPKPRDSKSPSKRT